MGPLAKTAFVIALVVAFPALAQDAKPDPWAPVRFMAGSWQGTAEGQAGDATVKRHYEFVMRETYQILGPDEFTETFELAAPGKAFEVYSKNHFRRVRP